MKIYLSYKRLARLANKHSFPLRFIQGVLIRNTSNTTHVGEAIKILLYGKSSK